ncbi:MAG: hypothetical protein P4L71_20110 [Acetobacteraceae bacterium]|nr:hypothetical protein [Acetobacteraceae bacterium]
MTSLNPLLPTPEVRGIRLMVLCDGKAVPGCYSISWTASSHYTAASWNATFAINADSKYGLSWWDSGDTGRTFDLQVGLMGADGSIQWRSLGIGLIDTTTISAGLTTAQVEGRDLAALLIDQRTANTYQNQTASEVVAAIAAEHTGMIANAAATTTPIGRFWGPDHTRQTRAQNAAETTQWDLLVRLAQMEGYDLYFDGWKLCFQPQVTNDPTPYTALWVPATPQIPIPSSGVMDLQMTRRWTLAKPVTVVVQSYNSKSGKTVKASASFGSTSTDTSIGGTHATAKVRPTRRTIIRANLTQDQAQKLANSTLNDLVKHERQISFNAPGQPIITPRNMVRLMGTGTDFDQLYYIDSLTKTASFSDGFRMDITAKNHSPSSDDAATGAT